MNVFLAGAEAFPEIVSSSNSRGLINYYYVKNKHNILKFKTNNNIKELFVDSGAFTAWTKNVLISIEEYCEFVKKSDCDFYSVLDVIGNDKATYENQKKMEELGCTPIPCFHYGDDFKYLKYYCENYNFVSLGGMVGKSTKILSPWLDAIFLKYPEQKFHGFGLTRKKLVCRYPWYSIDGSTWIQFNMTKKLYSAKENEFLYMGKDDSVWQHIIKNPKNSKWINKIIEYKINIKTMYNNYKDSLLFNAYGLSEFENIQLKNDISKQRSLF